MTPQVDPVPAELDPAAAEEALAIARRQRANLIRAARDPWWAWLVAAVLIFLVWSGPDLGAGNAWLVQAVAVVLVLAWIYLPRRRPGPAGRWFGVTRAHRTLIPAAGSLTMIAVCAVGALAMPYAGRVATGLLRRVDASPWLVERPHVVTGLVAAVLLTALAFGTDRALRAVLVRRSR